MLAFVYVWHRRLGLGLAVFVIWWALSGALHPLISRMSIPAKASAPETTALQDSPQMLALNTVLTNAGIDQVVRARVWQVAGRAVFQVQKKDGELPLWFDAHAGEALPDFGEHAAREWAVRYVPDRQIDRITPVLEFSDDYLAMNRYLPAWRIDFTGDDARVLFVDAWSGRPAASEYALQKNFRKVFQLLHTFSWLPAGALRQGIEVVLVSVAGLLGIGGLILYGLQRKRPALNGQRRWHRRLGVFCALFLIAFAFSGAWHALHKLQRAADPVLTLPAMRSAELPPDWPAGGTAHADRRFSSRTLLKLDGTWWSLDRPLMAAARAQDQHGNARDPHAGHGDHAAGKQSMPVTDMLHALDGTQAMRSPGFAAERWAAELGAATFGCPAPVAENALSRFEGDYGFLFKRLPVWPVLCADGSRWFFDVRDQRLALRFSNTDRAEDWSFDMLHKWHFLDGFGKDVRDLAMVICVSVIATLAGIGVSMWRLRQRKRHSR